MLDNTLVNIIRTRNMDDDRKRNAPKWQRVVKTVDWISTQLPVTSRYQVWHFNQDHSSVLEGTTETWLEVADRDQLNQVIAGAEQVVPQNGTNLRGISCCLEYEPEAG